MADLPLTLARQLELSRFQRALEVAESLASNRALLTTMELERINSIITGKTDPIWRLGPVTLTLPGGKTETLALMADPKITARDHLHVATESSENGHPVEAAIQIYAEFVLSHVFADGNRRTAVAAAHYFFKRYDVPISGLALHEIGLGDLREKGVRDSLKETVMQIVRFAGKR